MNLRRLREKLKIQGSYGYGLFCILEIEYQNCAEKFIRRTKRCIENDVTVDHPID